MSIFQYLTLIYDVLSKTQFDNSLWDPK